MACLCRAVSFSHFFLLIPDRFRYGMWVRSHVSGCVCVVPCVVICIDHVGMHANRMRSGGPWIIGVLDLVSLIGYRVLDPWSRILGCGSFGSWVLGPCLVICIEHAEWRCTSDAILLRNVGDAMCIGSLVLGLWIRGSVRWVLDRGASVGVFDFGNIRVLLGCYAVDMARLAG